MNLQSDINEIAKKLNYLWIKANKRNNADSRCIKDFWQYIYDNLANIDINELIAKDIPLLKEKNIKIENWRDYGMLLSPSGTVYMKMSEMLYKMYGSDISLIMDNSFFIVKDKNDALIQKIHDNFLVEGKKLDKEVIKSKELCFCKNQIILTALGNNRFFPEIEKLFQVSREFKNSDWQVVKFVPPSIKTIPDQILIGDKPLDLELVKYVNLESTSKFVCIVVDTRGYDLSLLYKSFEEFLYRYLGEYLLHKYIEAIKIQDGNIGNSFVEYLHSIKETGCMYCGLCKENVELIEVLQDRFYTDERDGLPPGNYCDFCVKILQNVCF